MSEARVLVVDDEPIVREILSRYLEKEGFQVQTADRAEPFPDGAEGQHTILIHVT